MTKELTIKSVNGQKEITITSLEVAEMVGRRHDQVLRDIRTIINHLTNRSNDHKSVAVENYFLQSEYRDKKGEIRECVMLTKKGCELYATRMTGAKGTQFAVAYIERFNEMEQQLSDPVKQYLSMSEEDKAIAYFTELKNKKIVEQQLMLAQPKVEKYEQFLDADGYMSGNQVAKSLGIGVKRLYKQLREMSIYKSDNTPYQKYLDNKDYFKVTYKNTPVGIKPVTLITPTGADYIFDLLKQDKTA